MNVRRSVKAVIFIEHRVEQAGKAHGPAAQGGLAFSCSAVKSTALFLQPQKFIGNIQRSKNCDTQGVSGVAAGRHGAHLRIDRSRQLLNVCRVVGAKVIGLIVDIHTDGRGSAPNLEIICHMSPVERYSLFYSPSSSICLSRRSMRCRTASRSFCRPESCSSNWATCAACSSTRCVNREACCSTE